MHLRASQGTLSIGGVKGRSTEVAGKATNRSVLVANGHIIIMTVYVCLYYPHYVIIYTLRCVGASGVKQVLCQSTCQLLRSWLDYVALPGRW